MRARVTLALAFLLTAGSAFAQAPVRYLVRVDEPGTRAYQVEAEFPVESDTLIVSLPAWTPGAYTIENYARYVGQFSASADGDGRALRWDRLDKDSWRIRTDGASRVRVAFEFLTDTLSLSGSILHDDFGFFNGTNLFPFPDDRYDFDAELTIEVPDGWGVATELEETDRRHVFRAGDYHELVDNPTFLGQFAMDSIRADGRWIRLAVYPAKYMRDPARSMALEALQRMAEELHGMFGGAAPYDRYTTFIYLAEGLPYLAGLEHSNSHLDILPAVAFQQPRLLFTGFIYRLLSHEYYHAWNVKRIRPAELWPYDYDREQYTPLLWLSEGITDYYAHVLLARTKIWSGDQFWEGMREAIANVEGAPVHVAAEDASLATWVDPVLVSNNYYYDKGAILGLLLDIRIRNATENRRSLDDVMLRLYEDHYLQGRGFATEDVIGYLGAEIGEDQARAFYRDYIDGREPLPLERTLALAGMRFMTDTMIEPFLGVSVTPAEGDGLRVASVLAGSAAARAGLRVGDQLLQVGEVELRDLSWAEEFRGTYAGGAKGPVELRYRRDGRVESSEVRIGTRTRYEHRISVLHDATELQRSIRDGLVGDGP